VAAGELSQGERAGRLSPQVKGPRGPGSLKVECHHEPPLPAPEAIPRRGDGRKKTVARAADVEALVSVLLRADPL
jgi:hypothetical protein